MPDLHLALSIFALLHAAIFAWPVLLRWDLNHDAFFAVVHKLIDAGQVERGAKLCRAAPHAVLPQAIAPLLGRTLEAPADPLPALAAVARHGLEAGERRLRRHALLGVSAGMSLGFALLVGLLDPDPERPAAWVLACAALAVLVHAGRRLARIQGLLQAMPADLIPRLLAHLKAPPATPEQVVEAVLAAPAGPGGAGG